MESGLVICMNYAQNQKKETLFEGVYEIGLTTQEMRKTPVRVF